MKFNPVHPLFSRFHLLVAVVVCIVCFGCTRPSPQPSDSSSSDRYTEGKAMSKHRTEPERAMTMIDSAVIVGNVTAARGKYLKAVTQYGGLHNYPLSRQTCLDLLKGDLQPDSVTLEQTYLLLTSIEYTTGNYPAVIGYATEASRLAHALDMPDEVGKMEGFIAHAMAQGGRTDEGIARLRSIIDDLKLDTYKGLVAYQGTSVKLLRILVDDERYEEMVPVCDSLLRRMDELVDHPDRFSGMINNFDPAEYADYGRGQALAFLAIAYARLAHQADTPGERAACLARAREADAEIQRTAWSQSIDCDRLMSAAYHYMGEFDRFDKAMRRMEDDYTDTINANVVICLEQRSEACELQGRYAEALRYMQRARVIHDSLDLRNQRDQLAELATVYNLQEEQLARQGAEADARFYRLLTMFITFVLVAVLFVAILMYYKRRRIAEKNRALVRIIDEMEKHRKTTEAEAKEKEKGDPALFERFTALIHDEQLYRNAAIDRDTVCHRLGIDRHVLNQLLNTYADGLSLPAYINKVRVEVAYELLRDDPDRSIADVAADVGFTPQNLRIQFKKQFGITPTEYRQNREPHGDV